MRPCQACRMANIKDGVKMTSTGAACSLDGRAHILCVSKQQEREESKRPRSVSGRRSNDTVSTFCTMKNISRFDEANTQKLPIYQTITPYPFLFPHLSPLNTTNQPPHRYPTHRTMLPPVPPIHPILIHNCTRTTPPPTTSHTRNASSRVSIANVETRPEPKYSNTKEPKGTKAARSVQSTHLPPQISNSHSTHISQTSPLLCFLCEMTRPTSRLP